MIALGAHWEFIVAAYVAAGLGTAGLIGVAIFNARLVSRQLDALERSGVRRRSAGQ